MKTLLLVASTFLAFFPISESSAQGELKTIAIKNLKSLKMLPPSNFKSVNLKLINSTRYPVTVENQQLRVAQGFEFARVKGFTATDDLWIVVPSSTSSVLDVRKVPASSSISINPDIPAMKFSCGADCSDGECTEKKCKGWSKRRCISCSGCCRKDSEDSFSNGIIIPSYQMN